MRPFPGVPLLTNVYLREEKTYYFWVKIQADGSLGECHHDSIGDISEALAFELEQYGDVGALLSGGWSTQHMLEWAMTSGIAPGQPFMVEMSEPVYSETWTDCGLEHDVEYPWDVHYVVPWGALRAARAWEREFQAQRDEQEALAKRARHLRHLERTTPKAMYLMRDGYCPKEHSCSDHEGWTVCSFSGLELSLWSNHYLLPGSFRGYGRIASAIDAGGSMETALAKLLDEAKRELPWADEAWLRALPEKWRHP